MKLIIREVAEREGIRNPLELSQKSGIPYASCHRLWNGNVTMIGIETLERLCTLFKVWPNQLFDYTPEPEKLPGGGENTAKSASSNSRTRPSGKPKREPRKAAAIASGV